MKHRWWRITEACVRAACKLMEKYAWYASTVNSANPMPLELQHTVAMSCMPVKNLIGHSRPRRSTHDGGWCLLRDHEKLSCQLVLHCSSGLTGDVDQGPTNYGIIDKNSSNQPFILNDQLAEKSANEFETILGFPANDLERCAQSYK